jgi:hypothetical protein
MTARQLTRSQEKSFRQGFEQRVRRNNLIAKIHFELAGPPHDQRWRGTYTIGDNIIGRSDWKKKKGEAKEEAAQDALGWLSQQGYH